MTALNYMIAEDEIAFAIDTLSTSREDGTPHAFITKYVVLPHLRTAIAGTGDGNLIAEWMAYARGSIIARDVEHLNEYAPACLRKMAERYPQLDIVTATLYHFGFSEHQNRFITYVYRSTTNWESELQLTGLGVKPQVPVNLEAGYELPAKFIEIMEAQRQHDLGLPVGQRVGIGGEIHFVHLHRHGYNISICHRFESYEAEYEAMCAKLCANH